MKYDIILKNGRIWNGYEFRKEVDSIAVKDGKITAIGKDFDDATTIFNVNGAIISPGLVDIHTHMKGISSDSFGIPAETVCFPFGVTTAVEAAASKLDGKILLDNMLLGTYVFAWSVFENGKFNANKTQEIIDAYGEKVVGVKLFFDTSNPFVNDISPLREVCDFAHSQNLKVLVHSTGSPVQMCKLLNTLSEGDICTHIFHGGKNNVSEDNFACIKNARAGGVIIDNGMAGGVHTDFTVVKHAIENGVFSDTISTDITKLSAFRRGGNYGLTLCMSVMRELGMTEKQVLRAVTYSAAKAIDKEHFLGTLDIGKRADIAVLDYGKNHFEIYDAYSNKKVSGENGYTNFLTICGGQIVYRANSSRMIQENYNAR